MINILFICSRNQWRSPTAEKVFSTVDGVVARSAGTEPSARIRLTQKLLDWADVVFVMEHKHKKRIKSSFYTDKEIVVLDIPDEYHYMDEELVSMIKESVGVILKL